MLHPLDKKLDFARKLDIVSITCGGYLHIILGREYGLKYKTHKYAICGKEWEVSVNSL